jgi:hypothetical protein
MHSYRDMVAEFDSNTIIIVLIIAAIIADCHHCHQHDHRQHQYAQQECSIITIIKPRNRQDANCQNLIANPFISPCRSRSRNRSRSRSRSRSLSALVISTAWSCTGGKTAAAVDRGSFAPTPAHHNN